MTPSLPITPFFVPHLDRHHGHAAEGTRDSLPSSAVILETFGLPKDGRYYKRLIAGFERPRSVDKKSPAGG